MEKGDAVKRPLLSKDHYNQDITLVVVLTIVFFCASIYASGHLIGFSSPAESRIIHDFSLTLAEYSLFVSLSLGGSIFGAIWTGKTADVLGRRGALGIINLFCMIGWLAIAVSKDILWLDVGRLLIGFGIGLGSYTISMYIAEIVPNNIRGTVMSSMPLFMSCGKSLFFVIGPLVHWRTLALIGLFPYLLLLPSIFFLPESPRWLMKIGKVEASENALQRIRGEKADISHETREYTEYSKRLSGDGILSLFQRKYARCLTIGIGIMIFQQFGGYTGVSLYTSSIFESAGFSDKIGSMTVGFFQILMAIVAMCLIDKFGRRPLLLISSSGTSLGCVLIGLSFLLQRLHIGDQFSPVIALAGVLVFMGFYSLGLEGIPALIVSEIFPINIKGAAGSIVNVVYLVCAFSVTYSFNFVFAWNPAATFFIFAAISGATVLFIWKMVPETKGRSLEEIQASITN